MPLIEAYIFDILPDGVIVRPDMPEPIYRRDVFWSIDPGAVHSSDGLIIRISDCEPLTQHLRAHAQRFLEEQTAANAFIENLMSARQQSRHQLILRQLRRDPVDGWQSWIEHSGDQALEGFLQLMRDWLDAPIDWSEVEHFSVPWNGRQAASGYFQRLPHAVQKALGVEIDEGEVLSMRFCAARLTKSIRAANAAAELLELDCRFTAQKTVPSQEVQDD